MEESIERLRQRRIDLNFTVTQVWRLVEAGNYDLSENTVRRFFSLKPADQHAPTPHTIEILNSVLYGTDRDEYDPKQAHRYYKECEELKLSLGEVQKSKTDLEAQCRSLAERLGTYEKAIDYYRRQLESAMAMNQRLLDMVPGAEGRKQN